MSKTKHTPGPWKMTLLGDLIGVAANGQPHHITRCEAIANQADARLISMAPDMLEVLRLVDGLLRFTKLDRQGEAVHDHVKAAIAKATGGAE